MKKTGIISFILLLFFSFIVNNSLVLAQSYNFNEKSGLSSTAAEAGYEVDGEGAKSIEGYISQVITIVLSVLGVIFLALMIYGGILWMTAAGNEEKVKKAKELITEAIIGLAIVLAAYAISYFVLNQLVSASLISSNTSTSTP
jgi:hypothetical protein